MEYFEKNIDFYISSYDIEKQLFSNGIKWKQKGFLAKDEFMQICLWKSRRPKKWYSQNRPETIENITRKAFQETDEAEKIKLLTKLRGVSIRCIQALNDLKQIQWTNISVDNWLEYLEIIRKLSVQHSKTARDIEKGLFAFNRIKLDNENKNLR